MSQHIKEYKNNNYKQKIYIYYSNYYDQSTGTISNKQFLLCY